MESKERAITISEEKEMSNGHGGTRENSGRKRSKNPSQKTIQNKRSQQKTYLANLAFERQFPDRYRFDNGADGDIERIQEYSADEFIRVGKNIYVPHNNLWYLLNPKVADSFRAVREIMIKSRKMAADSLPNDRLNVVELAAYMKQLMDTPKSGRHLADVVNAMHSASDVAPVEPMELNDRNSNCVIPFTDGTAYDIRSGRSIDGSTLKGLKMLDTGLAVPRTESLEPVAASGAGAIPDAAWRIIKRQYGQEVLDRLCSYLCGITKSIDVIRMPSNGGKTTLFDMLNRAFPGGFYKENATQIVSGGSRFTPISKPLAMGFALFIDEATHESAKIPPSMINSWDAEIIEMEEKYMPRQSVRRNANVCILASDDWPHVDASAQGFTSRFKWAANRQDVGRMESFEREVLLERETIEGLRLYMMVRSHFLLQEHNGSLSDWKAHQEQHPDSRAAITEFIMERTHPAVGVIQENFYDTGGVNDFVSLNEFRTVMAENASRVGKMRDNELTKYIKLALNIDDLRKQRKSVEGKQLAGYWGIKNL